MSTTRRQFAKALTAALAASQISAQEKEKPPSQFGVALTGMVRAQFGQYLTDEELAQIGKDFQEYAPYVESLRTFELKNSDEPDFTFHSLTDRW